MSQEFAVPVIQRPDTPKKLKKKFCFATIPLLIVVLFSLGCVIFDIAKMIIYNFDFIMQRPFIFLEIVLEPIISPLSFDYIITLYSYFGFLFLFLSSTVLLIFLLTKKHKTFIGVPVLAFSVFYFFRTMYLLIWNFREANFSTVNLIYIFVLLLAVIALLLVAVYIFAIIKTKKIPSTKLGIIVSVLFCALFFPLIMFDSHQFFITIFNGGSFYLPNLGEIIVNFLFPVPVILLLLWVSSPYKKNKSEKITQPITETESVEKVEPAPQPESESDIQPSAESVAEETVPETVKPEPVAEVFVPQMPPEPVAPPQERPMPIPTKNSVTAQKENIELIKQYKELLDMGAITQEEYEKKKNKLLGD